MHVDRHCVKMILEYAQLLSTAHRVLDGVLSAGVSVCFGSSPSGRMARSWVLPDKRNNILYKATHKNHPSAIWARQSSKNYLWLHSLLRQLCKEYTYRYGKTHKVEASGLCEELATVPSALLNCQKAFTEPTPAMPAEYIVENNSMQSYINYYNGSKRHLHSWKNRPTPEFIVSNGKRVLSAMVADTLALARRDFVKDTQTD